MRASLLSLPPSFFEHLEDRLNLAVFDTNEEHRRMSTKLQGLASKIGQLKHMAELEAEKLDIKIEGVAAKLPGVFSGAHSAVDSITGQVNDVDAILNEINAATNGAPAGPVPGLNEAGVKP